MTPAKKWVKRRESWAYEKWISMRISNSLLSYINNYERKWKCRRSEAIRRMLLEYLYIENNKEETDDRL